MTAIENVALDSPFYCFLGHEITAIFAINVVRDKEMLEQSNGWDVNILNIILPKWFHA